jgi:hypothetical protein
VTTTTRRKPKVMSKLRKEADLEAHVRTQWAGGHEFVEIRDYIPSTKTYGRGFVIERNKLGDLIVQLQATEESLGGRQTSDAEIPGQGKLF